MIEIVLKRAWEDDRATLGMLTVVGKKHNPFFTLENPNRKNQLDDRIPAGKYLCTPYSGTKYKDVYEVTGVTGRSAILIHWGNFEHDTLGCILLGLGSCVNEIGPMVTQSKDAIDSFRLLIGKNNFYLTVS